MGLEFPPLKVRLAPRQMQNFAAAIGDRHSYYYDDTSSDGILAHPCLPITLTWPMFEQNLPIMQQTGLSPKASASLVHYSDRVILHAPLRPKKKVIFQGKIIEIAQRPKGTELTFYITATSSKGVLLCEEYTSLLFRGISIDFPNTTLVSKASLKSWDPHLPKNQDIMVSIPQLLPYLYDAGTNIVFPIHTSPKFAKQVGLPGIIVQGSATLSITISELMKACEIQDPRQIREFGIQFGSFVFPGEDLTIEWQQVYQTPEESQFQFQVVNSAGKKALKNGFLRFSKS